MRNLKKIFFTLFLLITSIVTVSAKDTILTCEYYKPYDQSEDSKEVGVLCNIYNDYTHQCYINVGSNTGTTDGKKKQIKNWGYAIGLSWQAKKYVQENNKCPNYLLLKLDSGFNGYEIHAAASLEDFNNLKNQLGGQRYQATLKGIDISDEEKQKVREEIEGYTNSINTVINNYSFEQCVDYNNNDDPYINCRNIVSNLENSVYNWNINVNNWVGQGYFSEDNLYVVTYRLAAEKVYDFSYKVKMDIKKDIGPELNMPNPDEYEPPHIGEDEEYENETSKIENFCQEESILKTLRFLGYIMMIAKIIIPALLIILGTIDFSKAVISSNSDAISKSTKSLVTRVIAGIIVFLIPTIVNFAFNLVQKEDTSSFYNCRVCIFEPNKCKLK